MTSVFLRGANSYHTLVLIDGIKVNDPTGMNRGFNYANLTVDNIERIEILRGPQSTLYGADAMGGVINIITKKGEDKPKFYMGSEGGSYKTWKEFAGASMGSERFNASLSLSHNSSDGFSAFDDGKEDVELVITGRMADQRIIEEADLVTEMKAIKYYYQKGVESRDGIER
jgi:vitamin B12 transporter